MSRVKTFTALSLALALQAGTVSGAAGAFTPFRAPARQTEAPPRGIRLPKPGPDWDIRPPRRPCTLNTWICGGYRPRS